jgi:hypothetical protein
MLLPHLPYVSLNFKKIKSYLVLRSTSLKSFLQTLQSSYSIIHFLCLELVRDLEEILYGTVGCTFNASFFYNLLWSEYSL